MTRYAGFGVGGRPANAQMIAEILRDFCTRIARAEAYKEMLVKDQEVPKNLPFRETLELLGSFTALSKYVRFFSYHILVCVVSA